MTTNSPQRKRLTQQQKDDILANKGKMTGTALAQKHGVTKKTIYATWNKAAKSGTKAKTRVVKDAPTKTLNPDRRRIDFCRRWIDILQTELKRLENEPDLLKEAEAVLSKVIRTQK